MRTWTRSALRAGFEEVVLTASAGSPLDASAARAAYDEIAATLRDRGIEPIAEKVYGLLAARESILAARREALRAHGLDEALPFTFVEGAPAAGGEFAGVQVWGVVAEGGGPAVRGVPGGRLWQAPGFRALHLCDVRGSEQECVTVQAQQMFDAAAAAAAASGFDYGQTVRTWIYLDRLLDWYGELNRVRTGRYARYDFAFPASTGIQGRGGGECMMDVLLVDGLRSRIIEATARQGSAFAYGSSFSRGTELFHEGGSTVHVSGTASIDPSGRSTHLEDPSAQFLEMLLDVGAVLAEADMSLADIAQATLFCKDERTYAACLQARELLALPDFPTVCVLADVCRHELLVEMEAVAIR